jgi:ribosomal protein S27AE
MKLNPNMRMREDVSLSFNKMYRKKSIGDLMETSEGGYFVIYARNDGFVRVDQWFYPVCGCNSFMTNEFGFYLCDVCHTTSFNVTPK